MDHVIAEKHGGATRGDNLAYACTYCNRAKGTDVGSIAEQTGQFTRFFNPRTDRWTDHFALDGATIEPRTPVGEATARILGFNEPGRLAEREALQQIGRYPSEEAREFLAQGDASSS